MRKKVKFLLVIPSLIFLINILIINNNLLLNKFLYMEEKVVRISINEQSPYGLVLTTIYHYIGKMYDYKQEIHDSKTNISLEQLIERINSYELIEARHANLHNINDCNNIKYLTRNGAYEFIVKVKKNEEGDYIFIKIVDDPINKGTYNFFNQKGRNWQRKFHRIDIIFWIVYGTGRDDYSKIYERMDFFLTKSSYCKLSEVEK